MNKTPSTLPAQAGEPVRKLLPGLSLVCKQAWLQRARRNLAETLEIQIGGILLDYTQHGLMLQATTIAAPIATSIAMTSHHDERTLKP